MLVLDSAERLRQLLASDPAFKSPNMNQQCKVCNEPAAGFHFGAFTCEGCKSFFGRTYNNIHAISECKNNGECVINKKNRTSCKACRLRKCLMVGMSKSGSRYGRRSNWFKIHCLLQEKQQKSDALVVNPSLGSFQLANILRPKEEEECRSTEDDSRSEERLSEDGRDARITSQDARVFSLGLEHLSPRLCQELGRPESLQLDTSIPMEPRLVPSPFYQLPPHWGMPSPLVASTPALEQEHPIDLSVKPSKSPPARASTPLDLTKRHQVPPLG